MRVALIYDLFEHYPWVEGEAFDADVENEPEETVLALEAALMALGHVSVRVGPARNLLSDKDYGDIDVAINIAEGSRGRNREGEAPTLLELFGIPYIGSDALTLSLSLDKAWTKDLVRACGVRTPDSFVCASAEDVNSHASTLSFPIFVKPRYEGSAKGLLAENKVHNLDELKTQVRRLIALYKQDVLVESFVEGSEFTVAVVGHDPARTLPVIQRAIEPKTGIGLHVLDRKGLPPVGDAYELPGELTQALETSLQVAALAVFHKLECKDFARVDFRVDEQGREWFLEINPLPTFAPDGTFAIMAELEGKSYPEFLAGVLRDAIARATS